MDSILPIEQTGGLVFFNLCLILLMYILMKKSLYAPYVVTSSNKMKTTLIMYLFVLFSFWGADWFHYLEYYPSLLTGTTGAMEDIYFWIAQNLSFDYLSFRLIIWGGSLFLLLHIFKQLSIPTHLAIFFFATIYIIWFAYARVSLAMVLTFYGSVFLYKPYKNKRLSVIIGLLIIACAIFFHKSALFGIFATILAISVTKLRKKTFVLLVLCFPIFVYIAQSSLGEFLSAEVSRTDGGFSADMATGQQYLNSETTRKGPGYLIQVFLERFPHYMLVYLSFKFIRSKFYNFAPEDIKFFIRLQFFIVLLSSLFMFDLGANTDVVYGRFIRFSAIPSCIVLTYFYSIRYKFKYTQITYYLAFMGTLYAVVYSMYNAYVG